MSEIVSYLAIWAIIGSVIFSFFVIFVFRTRIVYTAREEDGSLKEKIPLRGYLTSGIFLLCIVGFLVLANNLGLFRKGIQLSFGALYTLNLTLYLILFLFDTNVIDGFVLGYWRPAYLQLPEAMGWTSMKEHMLKSIPVGTFFGLIIALFSTLISFYLLMSLGR
jgi:hypothetical protein